MKSFAKLLGLAGLTCSLLIIPTDLTAQDQQGGGRQKGGPGGGQGGRGNFNPEEFRQRMEERMREQFDVKDDAEWKILYEKIQKVTDLRREADSGRGSMMGMMFRPSGGQPGGNQPGGNQPGGNSGRSSRFGGGTPNPEAEALQRAIEAKAPAEEIKAKLEALRESRKSAETKLTEAQEDLKKLLTARQEALAVMLGLLK